MGTQAFANGSSQISSGSVTDGQGEPYAYSTGTYYPPGRVDKNGNYPVYIDGFSYPGGSNVNRVVIAGVTNAGYYYSSTGGTTNVTIYGNAGTLGFGTGTAGTTYTGSNRFTGANYSRGLCGSYNFRYVNTAPTSISPSRNIRSVTVSTSGAGGSDANAPSSYTIQIRDDVNTAWRSDTTAPATFSNLTSGRTYYFRSWANNDIGSSAIYTSGSVYIPNVPSAPAKPTVSTNTTTSGAVDISWSAPASDVAITGYKVYLSNGTLVANRTAAQLSFTHTGLTPRSSYSYYVIATNEMGDSSASTTSDLVIAASVPSAPGIPTVFSKVGRTLTLSSTRGSNAYNNTISEYRIQLSTDNGSTWKGWNNTTKTFTADNTYNVLDANGRFEYQLLTPALTYLWRVYAINSIGAGDIATMSSPGTFVGAGGKRFDGTNWNPTTTSKRFDGTNWVDFTIAKRFNGTSWVDLT